jgi:transcriptional regulator with XRE-family HTH domain
MEWVTAIRTAIDYMENHLSENISAQDVADTVGVHVNMVYRWENGQVKPSAENLVKLAALYDCSPDYLLDLTDERKGHVSVD